MGRKITYNFEFQDRSPWKYEFEFDDSNRYIPHQDTPERAWTKLEFCKCDHCPLKPEQSPHCPVARNLNEVVEDSKATLSIVRANVLVETPERSYLKECATQDGLRSLFGLVMASSGCPHLDWLRPLARFHLPFSDIDETLFRVLSLQLLEEFLFDSGTVPLSTCAKKIEQRYADVERVNHQFINRIRSYCQADADKNAIAALDVFVQLFSFHFETKFQSLRDLFDRNPAR